MDWIYLSQDRDNWVTPVNTVMNPRSPYGAGNFLTCGGGIRF